MSGNLLELPAEVLHIVISAARGDFCDGLRVMDQVFLGHAYSVVNNVIHTGYTKGFLVDALQIPWADLKIVGHSSNCPIVAWMDLNGGAQL